MHLDALLPRQQSTGCIATCPDPAPCSCKANEECIQLARACSACGQNKCVAKPPTNAPVEQASQGASKGALAGGVIGALVLLGGAIFLFLWYRRKSRLRKRISQEAQKDKPAPAETVLNRPNPTEKPATPTSNVGPHSRSQSRSSIPTNFRSLRASNPFDDGTSIQTAGTEGTNVIPIALVSPNSGRPPSSRSDGSNPSIGSGPTRPVRSPDLNLDHVNMSHDNLRPPAYAPSAASGISRNSYMSSASYASDFLNEAPMIMTPVRGTVRQVVGVVKAEVINTPGSLPPTPTASENLKPPQKAVRPSLGSPLAATSFGPADVVKEEVDEGQDVGNPFSDSHSLNAQFGGSPAAPSFPPSPSSANRPASNVSDWVPGNPTLPWAHDDTSRPSSMSTQAGSVIDIGNATRVNVGLGQLSAGYATASSTHLSASNFPRSPYRTTMARFVTPTTAGSGTLEEQQQIALAHAHAQAQAQGLDESRRISASSVLSATSTRADSILESFPFVTPSPISDRPIRSPPVSPLGKQTFTAAPPSPLGQQGFSVTPPSPLPQKTFDSEETKPNEEELSPPPSRKTLGLSTGSHLSTASSGLGSFPFQIDNGSLPDSAPPTAFNGSFTGTSLRHRASLDTLAITSDLSSYPLGFDRDSVQIPRPS